MGPEKRSARGQAGAGVAAHRRPQDGDRERGILSAERDLQFANSYTRGEAITNLFLVGHPRRVELLGEAWSCCDTYPREMRAVLRILPCPAVAAMSVEEMDFLANLPPNLTVFRGCYPHNVRGFSWTTSRDVAARFPFMNRYRHADLAPVLLTGEVRRDDVLFVKLDRDEFEIIPRPGAVKIVAQEVLVEAAP